MPPAFHSTIYQRRGDIELNPDGSLRVTQEDKIKQALVIVGLVFLLLFAFGLILWSWWKGPNAALPFRWRRHRKTEQGAPSTPAGAPRNAHDEDRSWYRNPPAPGVPRDAGGEGRSWYRHPPSQTVYDVLPTLGYNEVWKHNGQGLVPLDNRTSGPFSNHRAGKTSQAPSLPPLAAIRYPPQGSVPAYTSTDNLFEMKQVSRRARTAYPPRAL
ncbi:hypothetical protein HGRIS_002866 [Hohenbuehelia grisea]|uniref:Uncharacterized protein n=1 Tax=Hohenbuehelia grisea TaxID=104357 RepID=A0ABR3JN46_9AGAR